MKSNLRMTQLEHPGYAIAVAGPDWLLFDSEGAYLGTVLAPRADLMFGRNAPTLLLGNHQSGREYSALSRPDGDPFLAPLQDQPNPTRVRGVIKMQEDAGIR